MKFRMFTIVPANEEEREELTNLYTDLRNIKGKRKPKEIRQKFKQEVEFKTNDVAFNSELTWALSNLKGTKDFEDELTKNKSTAKTDIEDKYKKNVEQLEKSTANKPKNITQYVANKVNNKKIIAKENSPFSVDIQLSGIEELDKDKEHER